MPTTYTHHRFGDNCLAGLPATLRSAVEDCRGLYDIGVHGPDIFFYYHPLKVNPVSEYGSQLHQLPARGFFEAAKPVFQNSRGKKEMLVYLLGFLSHFTLDSTCHGYVEAARQSLGISHNRLEAVFDAYWMKADSQTPVKVKRGLSLHPSAHYAEIIARFFKPEPEEVLTAVKGQVSVMGLLYSPLEVKKRVLRSLIRRLGIPGSFDDLFVDNEIPEDCREAVSVLDGLYAQALNDYGTLAENLIRFLYDREELADRFDRNFE